MRYCSLWCIAHASLLCGVETNRWIVFLHCSWRHVQLVIAQVYQHHGMNVIMVARADYVADVATVLAKQLDHQHGTVRHAVMCSYQHQASGVCMWCDAIVLCNSVPDGECSLISWLIPVVILFAVCYLMFFALSSPDSNGDITVLIIYYQQSGMLCTQQRSNISIKSIIHTYP